MAAAPDSAKLHELLKSAARELKATQQELADERDLHGQARKALDTERAKNKELQQQLLDSQQALRKAQSEFATAAIPREALTAAAGDRTGRIALNVEGLDAQMTLPPISRPQEDNTNVSRLDPELLEKRMKALDQSLAEAEAEVKQHKQRVSSLEAELEAMKEVARPKTAQVPALDPGLQKEADESRARAEVAEERITALEAELAEARQAQARVEDLEAELAEAKKAQARVEDIETELAEARQAQARVEDLEPELAEAKKALAAAEQQLSSEQAAAHDVLAKFAAVDAELASVREVANKAAELEGQLASSKARVWELEQLKTEGDTKLTQQLAVAESAQARVSELTNRVAQLENDLAGIRSRRDELNVELARAENDRKKLTVRVADLESAIHTVKDEEAKARATLEAQHQQAVAAVEAKRAEADGLFQKEKEKHQHTAQRLIEARQKTREVETQLADAQAQLTAAATKFAEAENAARVKLAALEAEHANAVALERESHVATTATLQAHVAQVEKDLAHATEEWQHTNRQYEQLHREMIVLLDQRDEARRQLEALR